MKLLLRQPACRVDTSGSREWAKFLLTFITVGYLTAGNGADIPTGRIVFKKYDAGLECGLDLKNMDISLGKSGTGIPGCGSGHPDEFRLSNAPSALEITFQERSNGQALCDFEHTPKWRITMKTSQAVTNTEALLIDDIFRGALPREENSNTTDDDGIIVPGLRFIRVFKDASVGPAHKYASNTTCIRIRRGT